MMNTENFHPENMKRMQTIGVLPSDKIVNIPVGWEVAPGDDANVAPFLRSLNPATNEVLRGKFVILADYSARYYHNGKMGETKYPKFSQLSVQGPNVDLRESPFNPMHSSLLFRKRA